MVGFSLAIGYTPWGENKLSQICRSWRGSALRVSVSVKKAGRGLAGAQSFGALGIPT